MAGERGVTLDSFHEKWGHGDPGFLCELKALIATHEAQARRAALEEARDAQCIDCGCGGAIHSRNPLYHAYQSDLDGVEKFGPKCHADEIRKLMEKGG